MEVRQRTINRSPTTHKTLHRSDENDTVKSGKLKSAIGLTSLVLVSLFVAFTYFPQKQGMAGERSYAVVMDAGSTGSRVLGFSFHRNSAGGPLQLDDELWEQVKPGLSSYADNPADAGKSIQTLINRAKEFIPKEYWQYTPLTLKATAGLRLLPKEKSDAILEAVRTVLHNSGLKPEANLIEIMDPVEEGLFAWFTVNFLTDSFSSSLYDSYASLDLGGGSTQIVFAPEHHVKGLKDHKDYMHQVDVMKQSVAMYSHSYLGLGLMSARESVLQATNPKEELNVITPCMKSSKPIEWNHRGKVYTVKASKDASSKLCYNLARDLIKQKEVHVPEEMAQHKIAAFSYFFDRAVESKIIGSKATEGFITVGDFVRAAHQACDTDQESGFQCMDLSFISALLKQGYGLPEEKELQLFKKINGHEASWALGVAHTLLDTNE